MKKYILLLLCFFGLIEYAQGQTGDSSEVGITEGQLSVSLTGAATYSIPIAVPPGINGIVPQISLAYSSQGGNGIAGYGWNISGVSSITRIPATKFHDNTIDAVDFDYSDRFAFDGQRLFVKSGIAGVYGADGTVYETESFSNLKITSHGVHPSGANYGPEYFTVEYPDGSVAHYGDTAGGNGISRSLTEWSITYWENPQHVRINYFYDLSGNSLYLNTISYGTTVGFTPINHIFFEYDNRVRPEQGYVGGQSVTKEAILKKILSIGNGTTIRNYILDYDTTSLGYQRLVKITEKSGDESKSYNPTVFNYGTTAETLTYTAPNTTISTNDVSLINNETVSGDFNGDGKMDFLLYPKTGADARKKYKVFTKDPITGYNSSIEYNEGEFKEIFAATQLIGNSTSGFKLSPKQGWSVVKKGTATDEILFNSYALNTATGNTIELIDSKSYTFPSISYTTQNCNDFIGTDRFPPITQTLSIKKDYLNGDFNGDGLTDVIAIDKRVNYTSNYCDSNGQSVTEQHTEYGQSYFINLDKRVTTGYVTQSNPLNYSGNHKYLVADVNGDGKSDILDFSTGSVHVFTLNDDLQILTLFSTLDVNILIDKPILLGDYNGDGKMDFIIPKGYGNSYANYLSTGSSFIKTDVYYEIPFQENSLLNTFHIIPNDLNNDGKTDLILVRTFRDDYYPSESDYLLGGISMRLYRNMGTTFVSDMFVATNLDSTIKAYPIPIFLNADMLNQSLELAFISDNKIHHFNSDKDFNQEKMINSITTGNGVTESITYNPLMPLSCDSTCNTVYSATGYTEDYPNVDIIMTPTLKVVSQIDKHSAAVNKKQLFAYYGGVSNVEGLGFLGFRATMRTNWFNDTTTPISSVSKNDVHLRGANIENYTALGLIMPENPTPATDFISKSNAIYNIDAITGAFDPPLQSNKVFKLKSTIAQNFNGLDGTSSETRIVYDNFNNPTQSTTTLKNEAIIEQVTESTVEYDNPPNAIPYHIGRPTLKIQKVTIYPNDAGLTDTTNSEELYDYNNNLLSEVKKKGYNTDYIKEANKYDAYGNIITKTITAPYLAPRITNYEYDSATHRFLTKSTDIEGLSTEFTYDASSGLLLTELLPSNPSYPLQTTYEYDVWGKKKKITDYLGKTKTISYIRNYGNTVITTYSDDGSSSTELFDDLGRKTAVYSPDINLNTYLVSKEYDIYDRPVRVSEPFNPDYDQPQWNETQYDVYGRVTSTHTFTDKTVALTYNGLTTIVDDGIKQKTTVKNAIGNAVSVTDQPGGTIRYAYFANGHLKETEFEGAKTHIEQDGWGRKTKLTDPSAGTNEYKYNNFGETLYEKNENGETYYDLDIFGKVIGKKIVGIGNDTNSQTKYSYNGTTKLLEGSRFDDFTAGTTTNYTYEYDNYRRLYVSNENSYQAFFQRGTLYDDFGRPERELYTAINTSDGKQSTKWIRNTYLNGYHWQILDEATNDVLWQTDAVNARGQLTDAQYGNGIGSEHHDYDSFGLPKATTFTTISGGNASSTPFLALDTSFDAKRGNLLKRSNSMFNWGEEFKYDDLDRLVMFNNELGVSVTQDYNNNGSIKANTIGEYAYTNADKPYQVSTVTPNNPEVFEYYSTRKQDLRFNAFKKPITIGVEGAEQIDFEYNDFNSRAVMYYGSSDDKNHRPYRKFYAADGTMEIKRNVANNTVEFITYIGGDAYTAPLVLKSDGTTPEYLYLHRDYQGSILAITSADGKVVEKRLFDAWGALIRFEDGNGKREGLELEKEGFMLLDRGYTGHEHLLGVGLINMNGRLYDPKLHRFLSPDNNVQEPNNTQNFNRYGYCWNNPLKYTDASGEFIWVIVGALVGGVVNWAVHGCQFNTQGLVAFGIGAGAGALATLTGGAAFTAFGGAAGGAGGFIAGAASGVMGTAFSSTFLSVGNHIAFGDPLMTGKQFMMGLGIGGLTGGIFNGAIALMNGRTFWNGIAPRLAVQPITLSPAGIVKTGEALPEPSAELPNTIKPSATQTTQAQTAVNNTAESGVRSFPKDGSFGIKEYYPQNNGAISGTEGTKYLQAGDTFDRFGSIGPNSNYVSPIGVEKSLRFLPSNNDGVYSAFRVIKPFPVQISEIAPFGGAIQMQTPVPLEVLIKRGIIESIITH